MSRKADKPRTSIARVKELLRYEPETGSLHWVIAVGGGNRGKRVRAGSPAGCVRRTKENGTCYRSVSIDGKRYPSTHVIWALVHGHWPKHTIDHANGDTLDDRLENLREATHSQQQWNKGKSKVNTSGFKGVSPYGTKWRWHIKVDNKMSWSKQSWDTAEEAFEDRKRALAAFHGEFSNSGEN